MSDPNLPMGWARATVGDIAEYINGLAFKPSDWQTDGRPIIRIQNLTGSNPEFNRTTREVDARYIVAPGDILVSWSATLDAFIWSGPEAVLNQHIFRVLPHQSLVDRRLLYWGLKQVIGEMWRSEHTHGSTMKHINRGPFLAHAFNLPPLNEQRRIAAKIEALTARSRAARKALERVPPLLEQFRQSVLAAAFRGDLTAEWRRQNPDAEPASVLLERIRTERRRRWEETELAALRAKGKVPANDRWKERYQEPARADVDHLPELPDGWCWALVEELAHEVQYGSSAKCDERGEVPVLRMGNIESDGTLRLQSLKYLASDHAEFPDLLLATGDLLFNRTNSPELVGKTAVYVGEPSPCSFASYLIRVKLLQGVRPALVAQYINSPFGRRWIKSVVNQQVGQANVNGSKLKELAIPLPPLAEQAALLDRVVAALAQRQNVTSVALRASEGLTEIDQSILAKAFRGELVPQDPNDEPASVLLDRIRAEREHAAGLEDCTEPSPGKTSKRSRKSAAAETR